MKTTKKVMVTMSEKITFTPTNYTGWGAINNLEIELKRLNITNVLIVTDPFLKEIGLTDYLTKPIEKIGINYDIYTKIVPEPPLEIGESLVTYTKEHKFDGIIGLGGGSALDLSKLAGVLSAHEGKVEDYLNLSATRKITHKGLPKILVPTTSGTGSEVTNISVLTLESTKDVVTDDHLLADVAIIDPQLTMSLPPRVTAATGIDALTHAIEAYVSKNSSSVTDALAIKAINLISSSIRDAVFQGNNREARINMSYGSYLAGLAFFNAGVAGVHALAYPLGGQFNIAHGESNAVLLPYVMDYIRPSCEKKLKDIYDAMGFSSTNLSQEEASINCIKELKRLVKDVNIPLSLKEFNIPEDAIVDLANDALKQERLLARSPLTLNLEDIQNIYNLAYTDISKKI